MKTVSMVGDIFLVVVVVWNKTLHIALLVVWCWYGSKVHFRNSTSIEYRGRQQQDAEEEEKQGIRMRSSGVFCLHSKRERLSLLQREEGFSLVLLRVVSRRED